MSSRARSIRFSIAACAASGGVYLVGTWVIGIYEAVSRRPDRPLSGGYTVVPYPQLFPGRDASFVDGHAWVMPVKERTELQRDAVYGCSKAILR